MRKIYLLLIILLAFGKVNFAQINVTVSGTAVSTPALAASYTSLALALADLNAITSYSINGTIVFTCAAGNTETAPPTGLTIGSASLNPLLSATNTVTIIRAGGTVTLNAGVGTATPASAAPDGILKIVGADYITIDGLTFTDGNLTNPATMEFGLALFKAGAGDGCNNNTIQNCIFNMQRDNNASSTVPMIDGSVGILVINSTAVAATTVLTPTNGGTLTTNGSNSSNRFYSNSFNSGNYGIGLSGFAATVGVGPAPVATTFLGDLNNDIGGAALATGNSILNFGGGATATNAAAGIRANNQWGVNISYNTINNNNGAGVNHVTTLRGIYAQAGTSANASINNNNVTIKGGATTSQVTAIDNVIGSTAAANTVSINNNIVTGDYLTATSGVFYGIWSSASAATVNIQGNAVSNMSYSAVGLTGSGAFYPVYSSNTATTVNATGNTVNIITRTGTTGGTTIGVFISAGTNQNVNSNSVTNISIDGTGTASTMYGIQTSGTTVTCNNNTVTNIRCLKTTGTGALYGIYNFASPTNENYNFNTVSAINHSGTGTTYGIFASTATGTRTLSNNTVFNVSSSGTTVAGINNASSSPNIFKNRVYNISSSSTGNPVVSGIIQGSLGTSGTANIYNNLVGDITAPFANTSLATDAAVRGINITTATATATVNVYYNTVNVSASSSGTNFGACGLFHTASITSTTGTLNLRNNIIVNTSVATGTGLTVAYRRSSGIANMLANYASTSNNNLFYAGPPSATNLIYSDGTSSATTIAAYRAGVFTAGTIAPRDAASISEDPGFQSVVGGNVNFLKYDVGTAKQLESGAVAIATYTDDYAGTIRFGNGGYIPCVPPGSAPDMGAWELCGIGSDITPPSINYSTLGNTSCLTDRTLTPVTISDGSGVNITAGTRPRLYFKKSTNTNTFNDNTNGTDGWKFVEATGGGGSPFSFTTNYALLWIGTGPVVLGDNIQYLVVAQDLAPTPNVGINSGVFTATPASVALTAAAFPITGTINSYNIITAGISGPVTIGAVGTYTSLTGAGGLFDVINTSGMSGNVTANIIDASLTVSGAIALNQVNYNGCAAGPFNLIIKPNTGVTTVLSGSLASNALIRLNGADNVIIDGSNNGTSSRDMTITNTATTAPSVISLISLGTAAGAINNTIKNCNISTGVNATVGYGISIGGATPGTSGADNDNNTIQNNAITFATAPIYAIGTANVSTGGLDNLLITQNTIDYTTTLAGTLGIRIGNAINAEVSNNTISIETSGTTIAGISLETGTNNSSIRRNLISKVKSTNSAASAIVRGIVIGTAQTGSAITIANNVVYNVIANWPSSTVGFNHAGIVIGALGISSTMSTVTGGVNLYFNSVNIYGNSDRVIASLCFALHVGSAVTSIDCRNNIFANSSVNINGSAGTKSYAIYSQSASSAFTNINNNDYFASGAQAVLGFLSADQATIGAWQTATTQDANSIALNPVFNTNTDLVPQTGSPVVAAGTTIAGITIDFLGALRGSPPTIGAYENAGDFAPPAINYTLLGNTLCLTDRTLSATITDASGVNVTPGTKPRLYYRKTTNDNTYVDNTSGTNGWKYVEASNAASPFSFTTNYALLFGGVPVSGDVIQYFVVAQDLAATPNIGINSGTFAVNPVSVALTAAAFPLAPVINSYTITAGGIGGTVSIGAAGTYPTLTGVGGLFEAINAGGLTSNMTAEIIDATVTETGATALNQISYGCATYTLTIKPAVGVTTLLTGSSATSLIKLNGADNVIIDGSNNATNSRNLTIENTASSINTAAIWISSQGTGAGSTDNTVKNCIIKAGSNTVVSTFGIYAGGTSITTTATGNDNDNLTIQNNVISKAYYGIYAQAAAAGRNDNLLITQNSIGSGTVADYITFRGMLISQADNATISQNTVYNLEYTATNIRAMEFGAGFVNSLVNRNLIYNINYTATSFSAGKGMTFNPGAGIGSVTIRNNVIYGLKGHGSTTATNNGWGIMLESGTGYNIYYNSVNTSDNRSSTGSSDLHGCLYVASAVTGIDLRNNVLAMTAIAGNLTTGKTYGIYSLAANTAFTTIDYNDFYAPGSSNRFAGFIAATDRITLADIQTGFGQNTNSLVADPIFNSNTNLIPNTGTPLLNAAVPIGSIPNDYLNVVRSVTTPTIGAYENTGDFTPPAISYSALGNTNCTLDRTLTPVTITDASSVNIAPGTRPRLYFKKLTDANTYAGNTSGNNGWKYVEATGAGGSPFSFNTDYSLLQAAVVLGDNIQYFVVAQDLAGTPNVAINSGAFTATPASVALAAGAFPIMGTINSYTIVTALPVNLTVGAAGDYSSLTGLTGLFNALNNGVLLGNTTVRILDASVTETGAVALNQTQSAGCAVSGFTLLIKPDVGITSTLSGTFASGALIKILSSNVTIDGSNNGTTTRDLTINNTSVTAPQVLLMGSTGITPVTNSTLKNSILINGVQTSTALVVSDGTLAGSPGYFSNITIQNNSFRLAYMGMYCNAIPIAGNGNNLLIIDNDLSTAGASAIRYVGVYVQGVDGATVQNNQIGNFETTTGEIDRGIWFATGTINSTISDNTILNLATTNTGAFAPIGINVTSGSLTTNVNILRNTISGLTSAGTGSTIGIVFGSTSSGALIRRNTITNIKNTNSSGFPAVGIALASSLITANATVENNMISDVAGYGFNDLTTDNGYGISISAGGGYNIYFNSINLATNQTDVTGFPACLIIGSAVVTAASINVRNNIFSIPATVGIDRYAILCNAANTVFSSIDFNDYYTSGTNLGYIAATNRPNLAAIQAGFGGNTNSLALQPNFVTTTNLHLVANTNCGLDGYGTPIAGITTDFDNQVRDITTPDMGADEFTATYSGTLAGAVGVGVCENKTVSVAGTTFATNACNLIARVLPSGGTPVTGKVNTCVTLDGSQLYFNGEPYVQRHHDIEPATAAATATATVTLYYTNAEFALYNTNNALWPQLPTNGAGNTVANRNNVKITQFHGTATSTPSAPGFYTGIRELITPGAANVVWNGTFWEVTFNVNGFSGFYLHTNIWNTPLPITVNYFTGVKQGSNHLLNWKVTCNTTPRATMILERSADGRNFTDLNSITADALRCQQPFNYTDANPLKGINYYRLRMIDADGKVTYSAQVALMNAVKGFEIISIAPNPVVSGNFKLNVTSAQAAKMEVSIIDMQGRLVNRQTLNVLSGFSSTTVNVANLAAGTYTLQGIIGDDKSKTIRFVKQ